MRPLFTATARVLAVSFFLGAGAEALAGGYGLRMGPAPGFGFGRPGAVRIAPVRIGSGRFGRFPGAIYGAGAAVPLVGSPQTDAPIAPPAVPERLEVRSWSQNVVIHRGPAFGEPGYVSEPVVLRLHPAGADRFHVERIRP